MTALVTKHLPLVSGAPEGIKALRGLIQELALRGKLTPQDPRDTPASTLLRQIAEEQTELIAKGLVRQPKQPPELSPDSVEFDLPNSWKWASVASLVLQVTDGTHHTPTYLQSGIPFISVKDIDGKTIKFNGCKYISKEQHKEINARCNPEVGDILLCRIGTLGRPTIVDTAQPFSLFVSVGLLKLPKKSVIARFLHLALSSPLLYRQYKVIKAGGSHTNKLNLGDIPRLCIPVPPLAEQHRIVAKVDELMALCNRLEADQADAEAAHAQLVQALLGRLTQATDAADFRASWQHLSEHFHPLFTTEASIDALKQTVLQLAVMGKLVPQDIAEESVKEFLQRLDDARSKQDADRAIRSRAHLSNSDVMAAPPYEAPNGWTWRNLGSLLNITGGVTLGRKLAGRKLVSKPYLRVANVQRSYLVLDHIKHVEVPEDQVEKYRLLPNDLLITEGGDWDKVGRTAIWHGEIADCLHQNHVFRARAPSAEFSHRWAELYLNAQPARDYFAGSSKQTTNLASINMTQLRACAFPVPPLPEQHRIIAKVDELMVLCDQINAQLAEARQQHSQLAAVLVQQAVA